MTHRHASLKNLITSACLLLLAALLLTTATYAWLREGFVTTESEILFKAGLPTPPNDLAVWVYTSEEEDEALAAGARWVSKTVTYDNEVNIFPGAESTVTNNKYTFTLTSLHLGTVDNLTRLTDDNYVYLRMRIDPVDLGNTISFTLELLAENGLELYDAEGNQVTDDTTGENPKTPLASLYDVNDDEEKGPLLKIDYAVNQENTVLANLGIVDYNNGISDSDYSYRIRAHYPVEALQENGSDRLPVKVGTSSVAGSTGWMLPLKKDAEMILERKSIITHANTFMGNISGPYWTASYNNDNTAWAFGNNSTMSGVNSIQRSSVLTTRAILIL